MKKCNKVSFELLKKRKNYDSNPPQDVIHLHIPKKKNDFVFDLGKNKNNIK